MLVDHLYPSPFIGEDQLEVWDALLGSRMLPLGSRMLSWAPGCSPRFRMLPGGSRMLSLRSRMHPWDPGCSPEVWDAPPGPGRSPGVQDAPPGIRDASPWSRMHLWDLGCSPWPKMHPWDPGCSPRVRDALPGSGMLPLSSIPKFQAGPEGFPDSAPFSNSRLVGTATGEHLNSIFC